MMKHLLSFLIVVTTITAFADTPPPGTVKAKMYSGDGNNAVSVSGGGAMSVAGTFWQSIQPVSGTLTCNAGSGTLAVSGPLTDSQLRATPVPITGTITATNSANGATGSAAPAQATQIGGSDGTDLRAVKVSSTGVVSVDGSASTQPISAASLPLPAGAATAALQSTINTTLGSPFQAGGSIGNSSFGISGTLPAYASTPTFNLGTLNGAATAAKQDSIIAVLGSPFQTGGSIGNTAFGISGTLPAFAATPTFNLGTLNGAATAANQATEITALGTIDSTLGSPMQNSGGSVTANIGTTGGLALDATVSNVQGSVAGGTAGSKSALAGGQYNTAAPTLTNGQQAALQLDSSGNLKTAGTATVSGSVTVTQATGTNLHTVVDSSALPTGAATSALQSTINTTLGSPMQNSGGSVTANLGTLNGAATAANQSTVITSLGHLTDNTQTTQIVNSSGTANTMKAINVQVTGTDNGIVTNSVIHGLSTAGGGAYADVKVNPSGTLTVDASGSTGLVLGAGSAVVGHVINDASSAVIGHVIADSGSTTAVTSLPAIPAGTNLIGKVGIDQTTPGTTNGVQVNAALPAGTNSIGTVKAQASTPTALTVKQAAITVGTSAVRLTNDGSAPAATRVLLVAQLLSTSTANCYFGSSGVTTTSTTRGVQMFAGQSFSFNNDAGDYYAICDAATQTFFITEQE